jgi:hypothetical protein
MKIFKSFSPLLACLIVSFVGCSNLRGSDKKQSELMMNGMSLGKNLQNYYGSCRLPAGGPQIKRACQLSAIAKALSPLPSPSPNDTKASLLDKAVNRRRAMVEMCAGLPKGHAFSPECRLVNRTCDDSANCGFLKVCTSGSQCTKEQQEDQSLDAHLTMAVIYGWKDYLSIFNNIYNYMHYGKFEVVQTILMTELTSIFYDHFGKAWRKDSTPVKFADVSKQPVELTNAQSQYLNLSAYGASSRDFKPKTYLLSREYLEKNAFESMRRVWQYRWNDCLARSMGVATQCDPKILYQTMLKDGTNSSENIDYYLNLLLSDKDTEASKDGSIPSWPRIGPGRLNIGHTVVSTGGPGTYIGFYEATALCLKQNKLLRFNGHASVVSVFFDSTSNLYKMFTLDFQNFTQYEGLPRGYHDPIGGLSNTYSFVKVSNIPIPIDPNAKLVN